MITSELNTKGALTVGIAGLAVARVLGFRGMTMLLLAGAGAAIGSQWRRDDRPASPFEIFQDTTGFTVNIFNRVAAEVGPENATLIGVGLTAFVGYRLLSHKKRRQRLWSSVRSLRPRRRSGKAQVRKAPSAAGQAADRFVKQYGADPSKARIWAAKAAKQLGSDASADDIFREVISTGTGA